MSVDITSRVGSVEAYEEYSYTGRPVELLRLDRYGCAGIDSLGR